MKKLYFLSLGCAKNLVDSEVMLGLLEHDGYQVVEDPADADLLLVNTCGFIQPAVEEAVDEILHLAEYKEEDPAKKLVVTGCLVQRYGEALQNELPEVDLFIGTDGFQTITSSIHRLQAGQSFGIELRSPEFLMDASFPRRISTPFFRSYLKITEGCNNRCTYCLIPSIRGDLRSRAIEDLAMEACTLADNGVRELSLIAQDLTAYGADLATGTNLVHLLEVLLAETDIPWFRLLYLYPTSTSDDLLRLMAAQSRIVPYLDIPFQHVSNPVLQRMNRPYGRKELDDLIVRIRKYLPECALRTTMLVGFPGETESDVEELIDRLEYWQLDHVGVFQYQDEDGCAAHDFTEKVSLEEQKERYARVMEVQAEISREKLRRYEGGTEEVLVEGLSSETDLLLEGRSRFQAPDIDGCVYITDGRANPGDIALVHVTESHTYDLVGEITGIKVLEINKSLELSP
ncbi:MAG: 30S ribosomal protein S12 methylthiotransferase RimO [Desulfobulbaceae bacterium]|nr:30S ribosomal protein S12 methylthiotransferase RimO [Desulfobulbaceae bacterium]